MTWSVYAVVQTEPLAMRAKSGSLPTGIVFTTASVCGSIRVSVPSSLGIQTEPKPNATSSCSPGMTACARTALVAASMRVTCASPKLPIQTEPAS
jgi:hypothetical protein